MAAMQSDKKVRRGQVEYALPLRIGAMAGSRVGVGLSLSRGRDRPGGAVMKLGELVRLAVALVIAIIFIETGSARLPTSRVVLKHQPVLVYARPAIVAGSKRVIREAGEIGGVIRRASAREALRMRQLGIIPDPRRFARAVPGEEVPISLTQYCLSGTTRRGRWVRPGIVAADPRIFPLARYVEVFMGNSSSGRYLG